MAVRVIPAKYCGHVVACRVCSRLIDPARCLECYAKARLEPAPPQLRRRLCRLLETAGGRTELFVESYRLLSGGRDLYRERKQALNKAFLEALKSNRQVLGILSAGGLEALKVLASANSVDIENPWYRDRGLLILDEPVVLGGENIVHLLGSARRIGLVLDNAGEAVVDIAYALFRAREDVEVVLVARSEPYETDVTAEEARQLLELVSRALGIEEADIEVVGTGSAYPAPASEAADALESVDLVLMKGIANMEALLEYARPNPARTVLLLRAKCAPLAQLFRVELAKPIVAYAPEVARMTREGDPGG